MLSAAVVISTLSVKTADVNLLLSYFPGKHLRILRLVFSNLLHHVIGRHFRFTTPNLTWVNTACFSVPESNSMAMVMIMMISLRKHAYSNI